ncbi:DUF6318 family protein [Pauljensenia sp. 20925_1_34]|uniref:DUF6318 family protein n=1 Tax=Pauljensenia sp. 20925_1_34 TaxID=3003674 RepID=UPI00352FBBD8
MTEEDEEQFRRESAPRRYTLWERWSDYRADVKRNRPKGAKARFRAWMDADAVDWGIRVAVVFLFIGGSYSLYINGVAYGWWHAWGEQPTVAATTTPAARPAPSASSEPAMSGGYEIGPDGVLVRPAEHAASTYTKPELPEEAKENTERGAELAAEYLLDTLTYAWNTGDTQPFENMTEPGEKYREGQIKNVNALYTNGWMYGNKTTVTNIVSVFPASEKEWGVEPNTIAVVFDGTINNGIACVGQRIVDKNSDESVTYAFYMTWKNGGWISTGGSVLNDEEK